MASCRAHRHTFKPSTMRAQEGQEAVACKASREQLHRQARPPTSKTSPTPIVELLSTLRLHFSYLLPGLGEKNSPTPPRRRNSLCTKRVRRLGRISVPIGDILMPVDAQITPLFVLEIRF
jgi:hypothetical protein